MRRSSAFVNNLTKPTGADQRSAAGWIVRGNTYPHRLTIGRGGLGGTWDGSKKCWLMPSLEATQRGQTLVDTGILPAATPVPATLTPMFTASHASGRKEAKYKRDSYEDSWDKRWRQMISDCGCEAAKYDEPY